MTKRKQSWRDYKPKEPRRVRGLTYHYSKHCERCKRIVGTTSDAPITETRSISVECFVCGFMNEFRVQTIPHEKIMDMAERYIGAQANG